MSHTPEELERIHKQQLRSERTPGEDVEGRSTAPVTPITPGEVGRTVEPVADEMPLHVRPELSSASLAAIAMKGDDLQARVEALETRLQRLIGVLVAGGVDAKPEAVAEAPEPIAAAEDVKTLCHRDDVYVGFHAAAIVKRPRESIEWLSSHCWICQRTLEDIQAENVGFGYDVSGVSGANTTLELP